jgi:hypothetical protein
MEDIKLIYPDYEDIVVLNYFKGTVIKNEINSKFFFENNILKIKWNDNDDFDEFKMEDSNNTESAITKYIYISERKKKDFKENNLFEENELNITSIFIKDNDFEDYFFIKNYYITNRSNTYKGVYSFKEDFLIIKWENSEISKVYFTECDNSTTYYLRNTYENYTTMININLIEYSIIINYKNKKIYKNDNTYKPIGYYEVENEKIILYIKNNKYIYECFDNKLNNKYYYSDEFFKNCQYQNIILNSRVFIYDSINNIIFDKYNKEYGNIYKDIYIINNKFIIENKIYENQYINDLYYYEVTDKYNEIIYVKNDTWEENCIINRYTKYFNRVSSNEIEKMEINNNYLIVYWKNWDSEIFMYNDVTNDKTNDKINDIIYRNLSELNYLINNDFNVVNYNWVDKCKINNLKFIRISNNDYADFYIEYNKNKIIINWVNWGEDVYYILENVLYDEHFIYLIYNINDIEPTYLLNTYNNQLFEKYDSSGSRFKYNIISENIILNDNKININNTIYFFKKTDNIIYIYKEYFENKIIVKDTEFYIKLNILTNEINLNDKNGNYFFENEDSYLNIYWYNNEYNEIYQLCDDGKYYYKKYLDYSDKIFYIINNDYDNSNIFLKKYKIDYFKQTFNEYDNININININKDFETIYFLKNKNGDKFYLLINDNIKEFCIYKFLNENIDNNNIYSNNDNIYSNNNINNTIFLLDYKYNYLNDDVYSHFSPHIYKAFLKNNDLKLDSIELFKSWLEKKTINENSLNIKNDIYSVKTFIAQFFIDYPINILEKDIVKWYTTGNLIKIYETNESDIKRDIIIINIDNYDLLKKIDICDYDSNCDILINFNISILKKFDFTFEFIKDLIYKYSNIIYTISYNLSNYYILQEISNYVKIEYENIFYFNKNININTNIDSCFVKYNKICKMNICDRSNNSIYKIKKYNYSNSNRLSYFPQLYDICYSNIDLIQLLIFYYILNIFVYKLGNNNFIIKNELFNHIFN